MNDSTLQQLIEHIPVLSAVLGLLVAGIAIAWRLGIILLEQYRLYLDTKFEAMETLRAQATGHWKEQFDQFKELVNSHDKRVSDVNQRLDELDTRFVDRDRFIHFQQIVDHKFTVLARRLEDFRTTLAITGKIDGD